MWVLLELVGDAQELTLLISPPFGVLEMEFFYHRNGAGIVV